MTENSLRGVLDVLDPAQDHTFEIPAKRIHDVEDISFWLTSWAYTDLMTFLLQLNASMFPLRKDDGGCHVWTLDDASIMYTSAVKRLQQLLRDLENIIQQAPPDPGPRRFGNASFRTWYKHVEQNLDTLMDKYLPEQVLGFRTANEILPKDELKAYLLGSFGSAQRLDYGTGHELSFIAFLGCIWKLGGFTSEKVTDGPFGTNERQIVLGVIEPYLRLIRKLILTYTLEPAGSHGVWGLDDHSFVPYVFGSAQLSPPIASPAEIQQEGSVHNAPRPGDVTKQSVVERERNSNMYFSAIGFIYDVKKGPFWEHSPMLFDISGVTAGWAKINKGMIKMYNAEVLSKFPVVQHFPFGSLFRWEHNPDAPAPILPARMPSQPQSRISNMPPSSMPITSRPMPSGAVSSASLTSGTIHRSNAMPGPKTSWTSQSGATGLPATRAPWAGSISSQQSVALGMRNMNASISRVKEAPTTRPSANETSDNGENKDNASKGLDHE
ncbi:uncharacterized protein PV09_04724 [Verruconis gallopava]|uniref:Serine/threonine-protein phosphatase 2A activator n=1 Tax=Verruconis gallopava TaxID=253628 RepID=A0A0D1XPH7_9PEZI|nr:uncharacterized protein PV09_04724 [Verruconis gallopava]KIW04461.1 hypothetical protein PV09_04724 [Verruconis gallopava]